VFDDRDAFMIGSCPGPFRLEYDHAYDHVMSRGRRRPCIFHADAYYHAFLDTLAEARERFGLVIHG
jgi:putative transposase